MKDLWTIGEGVFNPETRRSKDAFYTLGNGYLGCRGFFEEEQEGIDSLGGIYLAGVFGKGQYDAWKGKSRELINSPNFLYVSITVNKQQVLCRADSVTEFKRSLNMSKGVLTRSFVWTGKDNMKVRFEFERFISMANVHFAGQRIKITPLSNNANITLTSAIKTDVTNLNLVSSEPLPVQPGLNHMSIIEQVDNIVTVETDGVDRTQIIEGQNVTFLNNNDIVNGSKVINHSITGEVFQCTVLKNSTAELTKCVYVYTSRDGIELSNRISTALKSGLSYEDNVEAHILSWGKKWYSSDIVISGNDDDQIALRYNIFQLIQVYPQNDPRISIGARGLTGEMYEGCVFWDTEIFKIPFFIFTDPAAAKNLLIFRYNTLHEARLHAEANWFKGAMFPWQVSEKGIEQTPQDVGAYYAIHIVADIAYAIRLYYQATNDHHFMIAYGTELLIETARFWASRVQCNESTKKYSILAVRGPNEYDVIVNNNVYTNMMAQLNMKTAIEAIDIIQKRDLNAWGNLKNKLEFEDVEIDLWHKIIKNIHIGYNKDKDLYEEDDMYVHRRPLDLKKAKPTAKRIIDSTMPYEALPLYQVTKQADVICLMNLLPDAFTAKQKQVAWDYYEPKTAHDSSLSYCSYAMIAARLGMTEIAYDYFHKCAYLDIEDLKLNTISGLHFANFGGTWQNMIYGFAGVFINNNVLCLEPKMAEQWRSFQFKLNFKGSLLKITIDKKFVSVDLIESGSAEVAVKIKHSENIIDGNNKSIKVELFDSQPKFPRK